MKNLHLGLNTDSYVSADGLCILGSHSSSEQSLLIVHLHTHTNMIHASTHAGTHARVVGTSGFMSFHRHLIGVRFLRIIIRVSSTPSIGTAPDPPGAIAQAESRQGCAWCQFCFDTYPWMDACRRTNNLHADQIQHVVLKMIESYAPIHFAGGELRAAERGHVPAGL